jgi:hypothetical protein
VCKNALECAVLGKWNAFNFETFLRVILLIFTAWVEICKMVTVTVTRGRDHGRLPCQILNIESLKFRTPEAHKLCRISKNLLEFYKIFQKLVMTSVSHSIVLVFLNQIQKHFVTVTTAVVTKSRDHAVLYSQNIRDIDTMNVLSIIYE